MGSPVMAGGSRPAHSGPLLALALVAVALTAAGKASAATFLVTNLCPFTVWPAAIPTGGGVQLEPGQAWGFTVPVGTKGGRVWGRTGCHFAGGDRGWCSSGDCAGALFCQLSGEPPATLAEFTIGSGVAGVDPAADFYDVSVVDGFNLPMDFRCVEATAGEVPIRCRYPGCPDANHSPRDGKVRRCKADSDYHVVFCAN